MPSSPSEEAVLNESVILDCLNQVSENKTPISLSSQDSESGDVYQTRIQSFSAAKKEIVLEQILPSDWREKLTPSAVLEIKSHVNMGSIRFLGSLTPLDESENNLYCKLSFPEKIFRKQLRDYYRVSLAKIDSAVTLKAQDNSVFKGRCRDISMSGAMITLPKASATVEVGQLINDCKISIDDILELEFKGAIRSLSRTDSDILAGIQFLDLSPSQLKPIGSALNKIERQNITT